MKPIDAREKLARRLFEKAEHLDPETELGWDELSDRTREFWRLLIQDVLADEATVLAAIAEEKAGD